MQSEAQLRLEEEIRKLREVGPEGGSKGEARVRQLEIELQVRCRSAARLRDCFSFVSPSLYRWLCLQD